MTPDAMLFDAAREVLEIIVHDAPADEFREARELIPRLRARLGMHPISGAAACVPPELSGIAQCDHCNARELCGMVGEPCSRGFLNKYAYL